MENTTKEYQPFNEEWKREMTKLPKQVLISMLSDFGKEKSTLKTQFEEMKTVLERISNLNLEQDGWAEFKTIADETLASLSEINLNLKQ